MTTPSDKPVAKAATPSDETKFIFTGDRVTIEGYMERYPTFDSREALANVLTSAYRQGLARGFLQGQSAEEVEVHEIHRDAGNHIQGTIKRRKVVLPDGSLMTKGAA